MTDVKELYLQGFELLKEKNYDAALEFVENMKRLAPENKTAYLLEIQIFNAKKDYLRLIPAIQKILPYMKLTSSAEISFVSDLLDTLAHAQLKFAMSDDALKNLQLAARMSQNANNALIRYGASIFCSGRVSKFSVTDSRILYAALRKYLADIKPYPRQFYAHDKIRVGFLSGDFRKHSAMKWSWSLLTRLDKNRFNVYCYSSNKHSDKITDYLREHVDTWRDICDLTDEQAAELIHEDEIDILIDLSGHTSGNRLRVAAYHPAAVQISGVGYTNSTGLDAMDYFLTDVHCAGNPDYFTEKLLILPHSHICYAAPLEVAIAAPPCLAKGYVTFGSFNNFDKMTDEVLTVWKKILDAVPNSRLIIKNGLINNNDGRDFVVKRLKKFGFDAEQFELRGYTIDYLSEYGDVDIGLDTFPFTGGITTCDALWMGVPVVSLYGDRHGTRIGLSILANVGLEGFATDSLDRYVELAVALAGDKDLLSLLRTNLRGMMSRSPLMDSAGYIRDVEAVFVKILSPVSAVR